MQYSDYPPDVYQNAIIEMVNDGEVSVETVDKAVSRILKVKFMLGLFENPYTETYHPRGRDVRVTVKVGLIEKWK